MKAKITALFASVLMIVATGIAISQAKFVPKPNEEIYGKWTNDRWMEVHSPGVCKDYAHLTDTAPTFEFAEQIDSKWVDSEGNIFCKAFGKNTRGIYKGYMHQVLYKLGKSATVLEGVYVDVASYDASLYPTQITDPNDTSYFIFYRAKE